MAIEYNFLDVKLNDSNDISFSSGDLTTCVQDESFDQHMKMRILTNKKEIPLHPKIGADLEELEGMPNTRATGDFGVSKIRASIDEDQTIDSSQISVRAVPTSRSEITFYTYAELDSGVERTKVFNDTKFSLINGLLIKDGEV